MGLENEIERIFRRVVESDLELISQSASATHVPYHTTPQPSCMCACGIVAIVPGPSASSGAMDIPIEEQIYRIQKIAFKPVSIDEVIADKLMDAGVGGDGGPHHEYLEYINAELKKNLETRKKEARDAGLPLKTDEVLNNEKISLFRVMAEHYRDEGPAVTILPRHMEMHDVPGHPENRMPTSQIISVGAVHYVLKSSLNKATLEGYLKAGILHRPVVASLSRWPVEITLLKKGESDTTNDNSYLRVDEALVKGGVDKPPSMEF